MSLLDLIFGGPRQAEAAPFDPYGAENEASGARGYTAHITLGQDGRREPTQPRINAFLDALIAGQVPPEQNQAAARPWNGWQELPTSHNVETRPHQEPQPGSVPLMLDRSTVQLPDLGQPSRQDHRGEMPGVDQLLRGEDTVDPFEFSDRWMNDTRGMPIYTAPPKGINDLTSMIARERAGRRK